MQGQHWLESGTDAAFDGQGEGISGSGFEAGNTLTRHFARTLSHNGRG